MEIASSRPEQVEKLAEFMTVYFKSTISDTEAKTLFSSMAKPLNLDVLERWIDTEDVSVQREDGSFREKSGIRRYTGRMSRVEPSEKTMQTFSLQRTYGPPGWNALIFDYDENVMLDTLDAASVKLVEDTRKYIDSYFSKP